ncbi:GntR family transcriptional regulator [Amorphus sp. 3PC139-8]|uniref:GntR family transcriptional regulator n=1 Tax=Amorphus sp. 3PC139-8 TaxID=2735676 RepID=UPI00345CC564
MSTSRPIALSETAASEEDWGGSISRESLSEQAYQGVRDALMHGKLRPGQKLQLRPLSKRFGISATPMREALLRLVSKEALTLDARGTVVVPQLFTSQLQEIRDLRMDLEGRCAASAAQKATDAEIAALEQIHANIIEQHQSGGDLLQAVHLNTEFHLKLCSMARLPITLEIVEGLWMRCGPILSHLYDRGSPFSGTHPHEQVIHALKSGDANEAEQAIRYDIVHGGKGLFEATVDG